MALSDVIVNISYTLTPLTRKEFNRALLLVSEPEANVIGEFKVYDTLDTIGIDYGQESVTYKMASALFAPRIRPYDVAIYNVGTYTSATDWTSALDSILNAGHTGWYYLIPSVRDDEVRAALVDWIKSQRRLLVFGNADTETPADFIAKVQSDFLGERVVACYHAANESSGSYLEAALVGWIGGRYPATAAWFHAKLEGVAENNINYSTLVALEDANIISWWKTPVGIWVTSGGKTTGGEWCDIVVALDFIEARIKERVWSLLVDRDRIPYTQEGIDLLAHAVLSELYYLARSPYGIIATDPAGRPYAVVYPPKREEIDPLEVRNRRIPDLRFEATVAGAVKTVVINGLVTEQIVPVTVE